MISVSFNFFAFPYSAGLKSMVFQGVKNPMVDLLSLEDKSLDEVMLRYWALYTIRNQKGST